MAYVSFAASKGVKTPLLWTASLLEARLYNERRDLLFTYFGISTTAEARNREQAIIRNISMRKRLRRELYELCRSGQRPREAGPLSHLRAIIHSVDDSSYPKVDDADRVGISGWFRLEMWDFYFNGLEFVVGIERGVIDNAGRWAVLDDDTNWDRTRFNEIKMYRLAQIPFENIVEADVDGDEYYAEPHFFCRFANGGQPYEGFRYLVINDSETWPLDEDRRVTLPRMATPEQPPPLARRRGRRSGRTTR